MMKFRTLSAAVVLISLMLFASGCKGTYSFNFVTAGALEDKNGTWTMENDDFTIEQGVGLYLQDANAACPKMFSGDFTMTFEFRLNIDGAHRHNFGFALTDSTFYSSPENSIEIEFFGVTGATPTYTISESAHGIGSASPHPVSAIPEFNIGGDNTVVIQKLGDTIIIFHEGFEWCRFDLSVYDSSWFGPNVFAYNLDAQNSAYGLLFKSITVDYDGGIVKMETNI